MEALNTLVGPSVKSDSSKFYESKSIVRLCCRKIITGAEEVRKNWGQLIKDLGVFRAQTECDKNELFKLDAGFNKAMPSKEAQDSTMKQLIDGTNALLDAAKQAIDEGRKELEDTDKIRSYRKYSSISKRHGFSDTIL